MEGVLGYHYAPSNTRAGWLTEMKASIRQKLDLLVDRLDEIDRMLSAPGVANDMEQFRKLTASAPNWSRSLSSSTPSAKPKGHRRS